jgi:hypothetical protein
MAANGDRNLLRPEPRAQTSRIPSATLDNLVLPPNHPHAECTSPPLPPKQQRHPLGPQLSVLDSFLARPTPVLCVCMRVLPSVGVCVL